MREGEIKETRRIAYIGVLVALSYIGSLIKIYDSIALDAIPGYFAALFMDPLSGALVASMGHILTGLNSGFPRTLPIHIIIALGMGLSAYSFGYLTKKINLIIGIIIGTLISSIGMLAIAGPLSKMLGLPLSGMAMFTVLAVPLTLASLVNIILGYMLYKVMRKRV